MKRCYGCMQEIEDHLKVCPFCGYDENTKPEGCGLRPGTYLKGKYLVGRTLGEGGFGITYIGYDQKLDSVVAIKEYFPSTLATRVDGENKVTIYTGDNSFQFEKGRNNFLQEAEKLASLRDEPEIVRVIDYFEENQSAYIVMEYLDGETLKARLKRDGKIPPEEAMKILCDVLKGLDKVHAKGMLHRDIAPDNISLLKDGRVKIFDFGSARKIQNSGSRSLSVEIKQGFSPVEQYRKTKDQGTWTDVYAAAATFYYMVTGKVPQDSLARKDRDKLKAPSKMGVKLPRNVQNAVMNALCVEPEHRTKTAEAFLQEIENELTQRKKVETLKKDIGSLPFAVRLGIPLTAVVLIILAVLLSRGVFVTQHVNPDTEFILEDGRIRIPNMVNTSLDEAMQRAENIGFVLKVTEKEFSDTIPVDRVLSQSVSAGSITDSGAEVSVALSAGIEKTYAPYLVGLSKEEAEELLLEKGFLAEFSYTNEDSCVCPDHVISQDPMEDTDTQTGDTIHLLLSRGSTEMRTENITGIPELKGLLWKDALALAKEKGFYLSRKETIHAEEPQGSILFFEKEEGSSADGRMVVSTVVSAGPEKVSVPQLAGTSLESAKTLLDVSGLNYAITEEETDDTEKIGIVAEQDVAAGERVPAGTEIHLIVGKAREAETSQAQPQPQRQNTQPVPQPQQQPQGGEPPTIMDNNG